MREGVKHARLKITKTDNNEIKKERSLNILKEVNFIHLLSFHLYQGLDVLKFGSLLIDTWKFIQYRAYIETLKEITEKTSTLCSTCHMQLKDSPA